MIKLIGNVEVEGNLDINRGTVRNDGVNISKTHRHPETDSITGTPQ